MWGRHLCLDLYGCNDKIKDPEAIARWMVTLVRDIQMVAYGEPQLAHFATHSTEASGYTIIQMIETSHIVAEFAENLGEMYLSLFSCKDFDSEIVIRMTAEFFEATSYEKYDMRRGSKISVYKIARDALKHLTGFMGRAG